jgi:hypothetical protein
LLSALAAKRLPWLHCRTASIAEHIPSPIASASNSATKIPATNKYAEQTKLFRRNPCVIAWSLLRVHAIAECKNEKATRQLGGLFFKGE